MTLPPTPTPPEEERPASETPGDLPPFLDQPIRLPEEAPHLPSPRLRSRRRRRAILVRPELGARAEFMENMARRAYPTYEFFIFSALAGAVMGLGFLVNAQALLIFAALLAPILTPWVGVALATVTGSGRYFFQSLLGFLLGGFIVFGAAVIAGLAARIFMPRVLDQAFYHSRLWWPDLFVLAVGAVLLVASFVRSEEKPLLPSVMLTYELYLPLSAAGFGLGVGQAGLWPDGMLVFGIHLAIAALLGIITFFIMGFRPLTFAGYTFTTTVLLIGLVSFLGISGIGAALSNQLALPGLPPTLAPSATPTDTPLPETPTAVIAAESTSTPTPPPATSTPRPATQTATPTLFIPPTETPTSTITPEPTPVYARIAVAGGDGVIIRKGPGYDSPAITSLQNGILVQVLPDVKEIERVVWVRIIALIGEGRNIEGWVVQNALSIATPAVPTYQPTSTP